ncbi:hypothetical protein NGA_0730300, partial [Nannochloropsis gaditana CCMP526]
PKAPLSFYLTSPRESLLTILNKTLSSSQKPGMKTPMIRNRLNWILGLFL